MSGYGKVIVVRDMNIEIKAGEVVSIIGRNGVGKSTLVKTVMGLIRSREGVITFNNNEITKSKSFDRARIGIGYVPQGHAVFPQLTVEENLRMGKLINMKKEKQDFEVVYEYFPRLKERKTQKAGTLSGGERAMLSISRALIGNPDLLLLDEPSEGVQPNIVEQIIGILKIVNEETGLTILLVEQHMGLIQKLSNRCYAMDKGSIIASISSEELADYEILKKYLAV